ncbi:MAG: hypothetical protein R2883_02110 [Caldisericia bacterium]
MNEEEKNTRDFSYIVSDPGKTDKEKLEEIDRLIDDELVGISDVNKMKRPRSKNMLIATILIVVGMSMIFMDVTKLFKNQIWFSILGFFMIVPGIGFSIAGIVDIFPDKLAKMDYMDEAKERLRILRREKQLLENKTSNKEKVDILEK